MTLYKAVKTHPRMKKDQHVECTGCPFKDCLTEDGTIVKRGLVNQLIREGILEEVK